LFHYAHSVPVSFDTVEQNSSMLALIEYDVYIGGNGQMQILQQGKPIPPVRIVRAAGFGPFPNSVTRHLMAELHVPLTAGPLCLIDACSVGFKRKGIHHVAHANERTS